MERTAAASGDCGHPRTALFPYQRLHQRMYRDAWLIDATVVHVQRIADGLVTAVARQGVSERG
jgi:hypothetical protein